MEPTNEQIRKVLAEFMGWEEIELCTNCGQLHGERPGGSLIDDVPDYTNDLNAMHDVEVELANCKLRDAYVWSLERMLPLDEFAGGVKLPYLAVVTAWHFAHATAEQRARAAYAVIKALQQEERAGRG